MVPASSMSPSQMFQERIVINMSGKFITAITFHFLFLFIPIVAVRNCIYFFSSKSKVMRRPQVMIQPMGEASFLKVNIFPSKSKWKPRGPVGRINQPKKSYSGHTIHLFGLTPNLDSLFIHPISSVERRPPYALGYSLSLAPKSLPSCHYCVHSSFAQCRPQNPRSKGQWQVCDKDLGMHGIMCCAFVKMAPGRPRSCFYQVMLWEDSTGLENAGVWVCKT